MSAGKQVLRVLHQATETGRVTDELRGWPDELVEPVDSPQMDSKCDSPLVHRPDFRPAFCRMNLALKLAALLFESRAQLLLPEVREVAMERRNKVTGGKDTAFILVTLRQVTGLDQNTRPRPVQTGVRARRMEVQVALHGIVKTLLVASEELAQATFPNTRAVE
jgi:hypothetical protein